MALGLRPNSCLNEKAVQALNRVPFGKFNKVNSEPMNGYLKLFLLIGR